MQFNWNTDKDTACQIWNQSDQHF